MKLRSTTIEHARHVLVGVVAAVVIGIAVVGVHGASLDDYQKRLGDARVTIGELQGLDYVDSETADFVKQEVSSIRNAIPRTEKIEWPGGTIETDNVWLYSELDRFAGEPNIDKRDVILARIDDRLLAIESKVTELNNATAAGPTKDEEKRKLAEILRREEYQKPAAREESLFQKWWREFLEWLARMFPSVNIVPQETSGLGSFSIVLQIILYALLAAAVGFIIYRFLPFFSSRFRDRTKIAKDDRVILGERIGENRSSGDLFAEAEQLARSGELRLAIRKGYIALLCELADRKVIGLARHKTNRDYLRDVRAKRELFENMRGLTGSFETHWYGPQISDEKAWEDFREQYRRAIAGI